MAVVPYTGNYRRTKNELSFVNYRKLGSDILEKLASLLPLIFE